MNESEQKLLVALVLMVDQYLDKYGDEVDSRSMCARQNMRLRRLRASA